MVLHFSASVEQGSLSEAQMKIYRDARKQVREEAEKVFNRPLSIPRRKL